MAFTTGQVLSAAQLNDLSINTLTTAGAAAVGTTLAVTGAATFSSTLALAGNVTLTSGGPNIRFVETDATAGIEYDVVASEAGSFSVRSSDDSFTSSIKRIEIDGFAAATVFRVNNGAGVAKTALTLEHSTGNVHTQRQFMASSGAGTVAAPTYSFADDTDTGFFLDSVGDLRTTVAGGSVTRWQTTYFGPVTGAGTYHCGASSARWGTYYGTNADDITSDMRLKNRTGDGLGLDFIEELTPFAGRWKNEGWGTTEHQWLSAQNVATALDAAGLDASDSALWNEDEDGHQSLVYTELVPVLISAVQTLSARIAQLESTHGT